MSWQRAARTLATCFSGPTRWPPRVAVAAALGSLALLAGGCGGSSSDQKANNAYASSVCTAVGDWEQQVKSIATDWSGGVSKSAVEDKAGQIQSATKDMVSKVKAVPPPDTSEGQAAKQQIDQLSSDVTKTVDAVKSAADQIQGNASLPEITAAVTALAPQVKSLATTAKSTVSTLQDVGGSLSKAFKSSDACKSLTG